MSFFDQQAPPRDIGDERVVAWNKEVLNTHENADYKPKARQAQNAMADSSILGGKIVKANHVEPRSNLPSNGHGFGNTNNSSKPPRAPLDTRNGGSRFGGSQSPAWSGRTSTGPTNFAKDAPSGLDNQPSPSPVKESPVVHGKEKGLPPHLRHRSMTPAEDTAASSSKLSKRGTRAPPVMNAGAAAKSAKLASKFPCTYPDCTLGFAKEKALKNHKEEEHHYCRFCDEDFHDFDDLLYHKLESEVHICCCICGEDFRSEAGRDCHERQSHAAQHDCICVGCGIVFGKGSALVRHIYNNECRSDRIPKLINQDTMRQQRAQAALHMDAMSHLESSKKTSKMIADMQPPEDDTSSLGGVRLEPGHLLDNQDPMGGSMVKTQGDADATQEVEDDLVDFSETARATATMKLNDDFPSLGDTAKVKDKKKQNSVAEGLTSLTLHDAQTSDWSKVLFAGVASKSEAGQGTGVTMVDYRRAIIPGEGGVQHLIATDWDQKMFKRHPIDGYYHCPFTRCQVSSIDIDDLKRHLTSGVHQGTSKQCLKCLRHFKTIPGLIAHMESNSERCKMKETDQFGQMLSVVSGGFLGVKGRSADGSIKICALDEVELAEQAEEQRELQRELEDLENSNINW